MSKDRAIQLRDMALAIIQPDSVPLPIGSGVERFLDDRLTVTLRALLRMSDQRGAGWWKNSN